MIKDSNLNTELDLYYVINNNVCKYEKVPTKGTSYHPGSINLKIFNLHWGITPRW